MREAPRKDSGVIWLGQVPAHWSVNYLGNLVQVTGGSTPSKENLAFWDGSIPWISPKDMKRDVIDDSEDHVTDLAMRRGSLRLVPKPAVLMVIRGMILDHTVPIALTAAPVTLNQDMKALRPRPGLSADYLALFLRAVNEALLARVAEAGHGTKALRTDLWRKLPVLVPPPDEQRMIVSFLARKTAAIDALLAKKERLIDLLQEKRQALITHAVTKGLDSNVPMKESGVDWLGMVPSQWSVHELRHRIRRIEQGWSPSCDNREADDGEWGVLKVGCVNYGGFRDTENKALPLDLKPLPELEVRSGDVLVSRANTRELVGSAAFVERTRPRLLLCDKLFRIGYRASATDPRFLVLLLQSDLCRFQFEREATGASGSMQNIGQDSVRRLLFGWPPLEEQRRLVAHVGARTTQIDGLRSRLEAHIDRLREYRQAVITAAVTGKIDVSKAAA